MIPPLIRAHRRIEAYHPAEFRVMFSAVFRYGVTIWYRLLHAPSYFNTCLEQVVADNYHLLFDNLDYFITRFELYNTDIRIKIVQMGMVLLAAAFDTALFTDGKSLHISRPGGSDINQARLYSDHYRVYYLGS